MDKGRMVFTAAVIFLVVTTWGAKTLEAADCGEPVPAPKYQAGDKWLWRNERGVEDSSEVVGFEGELAQIKSGQLLLFVDPDRVLRKVVRPNAQPVTKQGTGRPYETIGQKELDFPLQVGKSWSFTFLNTRMQMGTQQFKVAACEQVSTPAGKFAALRIESEVREPGWNGVNHLWYGPAARAIVRRTFLQGYTNVPDYELVRYELK
jgi:hypothetical protein